MPRGRSILHPFHKRGKLRDNDGLHRWDFDPRVLALARAFNRDIPQSLKTVGIYNLPGYCPIALHTRLPVPILTVWVCRLPRQRYVESNVWSLPNLIGSNGIPVSSWLEFLFTVSQVPASFLSKGPWQFLVCKPSLSTFCLLVLLVMSKVWVELYNVLARWVLSDSSNSALCQGNHCSLACAYGRCWDQVMWENRRERFHCGWHREGKQISGETCPHTMPTYTGRKEKDGRGAPSWR